MNEKNIKEKQEKYENLVDVFYELDEGEGCIFLNELETDISNFIVEVRRQRDVLIQLVGEESLHQDGMYKTEMQKLHETNKCYKQALKFYADQSNYKYTDISMPEILADNGEIANKALEVKHD